MKNKKQKKNIIKKVLFFVAFFAPFLNSFATFQKPDLLIINKDTFKIYSYPLEKYFQLSNEREIPGLKSCVTFSTACYRGYQAIWRIENAKLYLERVQGCHISTDCKEDQPADLQKMFGDKVYDGKVLAEWVTDSLSIPIDAKLQYTPLGYPTVSEKERLIVVTNGQIILIKEFQNIIHNNKKFSRYDFAKMKDTIFNLLNKKFNWRKIPKDDDDWSFEKVRFFITKEGNTRIDFIDNLEKVYADEIRRILKNLKFEIVQRFGIPYESEDYFQIYFDIKAKKIVDDLSKVSD